MIATATMTGEQFDALPYEEGRRWELVYTRTSFVNFTASDILHSRLLPGWSMPVPEAFRVH